MGKHVGIDAVERHFVLTGPSRCHGNGAFRYKTGLRKEWYLFSEWNYDCVTVRIWRLSDERSADSPGTINMSFPVKDAWRPCLAPPIEPRTVRATPEFNSVYYIRGNNKVAKEGKQVNHLFTAFHINSTYITTRSWIIWGCSRADTFREDCLVPGPGECVH